MQELLKKYDIPGPRYTSYPPAPHFEDNFPASRYQNLLRHLSSSIRGSDTQPLSLYLHFPFCDTLCYFCGCTMQVSNDRRKIHEYLDYLKGEIALVASLIDRNRFRVTQMHWGGGSPTHLLPEEIEEISAFIRQYFEFAPSAEISIEVDPRGFTLRHAEILRYVGFNRASIGVQDFFPDTQWAINRIQTYEMTRDVISLLRGNGIESINIDLIYGLPYQTVGTFQSTLDQVISLHPDRIAVYNFAYVPWVKPHQKVIQIETLPPADRKVALHYTSIERLTEAGYEYIGMDHYARHEDELAKARRNGTLHRNFQGYSTKAGTCMIGMGMSSIGTIYNEIGHVTYIQNYKTLDKYYKALDDGILPVDRGYELTEDDRIRENVISSILCQLRVDVNQIEREFGVVFRSYFKEALLKLQQMAEDGLVDLRYKDGVLQEITIPKVGSLFLRNIAMCFDAWFPAESRATPLYSKTL